MIADRIGNVYVFDIETMEIQHTIESKRSF